MPCRSHLHDDENPDSSASAPSDRRTGRSQRSSHEISQSNSRSSDMIPVTSPTASHKVLPTALAEVKTGRAQSATPRQTTRPHHRSSNMIPIIPSVSPRQIQPAGLSTAQRAGMARTDDFLCVRSSRIGRPQGSRSARTASTQDCQQVQPTGSATSQGSAQAARAPAKTLPQVAQSDAIRAQSTGQAATGRRTDQTQSSQTSSARQPTSLVTVPISPFATYNPESPSTSPVRLQIGRLSLSGECSKSRGSSRDPSVAGTGENFCPKHAHGVDPPLPGPGRSRLVRAPGAKMGIGIETEFMLKARQPEYTAGSVNGFAGIMATNHNKVVGSQHPAMYNSMTVSPRKKTLLGEWALTKDGTIDRRFEPWGIEMTSPILVAYPASPWRRHVEATWKFLQQHYHLTGDECCSTHVHVSVEGGYSLDEIKRVAQASIHFEPALDALIPPHRRGGNCEFTKSSWLDSDHFALESRARLQSVAYIDKITDFHSLLLVMNPDNDKKYGWNFHSIKTYYTIEFRKPQASTMVNEVLSWAELAMSFVQAAIQHGSPHKLAKVPPTVGGLRWFLGQSHVLGLNEPQRLQWFWKGKRQTDFVEAMPMRLFLSSEDKEVIESMREIDMTRIKRSVQTARKPYW